MWNQQTPSNSGSFCRSEQKPDILNQVFESPTGLVASAVTPQTLSVAWPDPPSREKPRDGYSVYKKNYGIAKNPGSPSGLMATALGVKRGWGIPWAKQTSSGSTIIF